MRNAFLLLVVLICLVVYVRAQQPLTWNSWMVAAGANSLVVPTPADSGVAAAPAQPAPGEPDPAQPPPVRQVPVGGSIQEGNFASGGRYWQGDGRADPSGKGLVVILDPSSWTRVYQTFSGDQRVQYSIEITYKLSPGLTVSKNPADYTDINKRVGIAGYETFNPFNGSPGDFFGTIGDPTSRSVAYEYYQSQFGSTDVQDYQHAYPPVPPNGNMTFGLAFPPGTGAVTLLTAYVTSR